MITEALRYRVWFLLAVLLASCARADDGYRLWLRYDRIEDAALRQAYAGALREIVMADTPSPAGAATLAAARDELVRGLGGLLGERVPVGADATRAGALVAGTAASEGLLRYVSETELRAAGEEGFVLRRVTDQGGSRIVLVANRPIGVLYGAFALLRHLQLHRPLENLDLVSAPRIQRRLLNHWDNLNGFIERGYAGHSLWRWFELPDWVDPRLQDYARANASVGINGAVLNNVNADSLILTPAYLAKVAAIAKVFRPYGVRVYLSVRFSAPIDLGGLKTADPLDPQVAAWWRAKADEIYELIPDFGGWLVKANSEGEPGPRDYGRTHLDGANALADALVTHGGLLIWRAFVYDDKTPDDRAKQAYNEFQPQDGRFRTNCVLQVKNGPIDFMPREPFHPLFGAMPATTLGLEVQITQEYLGSGVQLAFLAPLWKECLDADTYERGAGSTVARVVDGTLDRHGLSLMAGVANTGDDRNWTGHPLAQANWYAFGRLAWDHELTSQAIAEEWTRQTFGSDPRVVASLVQMLVASREAVVDYSMPLGLAHLMASDHHYGPGPWVDTMKRRDWNPTYYHRADAAGLGFDRTATGSNAVAQYAPPVAKQWGDLATCPESLLLWFHHVPWDYRMHSGRTLWDELCVTYQTGVEAVRGWERRWSELQPAVDAERFAHVRALLARQERDARQWRDACLQYFQTFSGQPLPAGVEPPEHSLAYYEAIRLHYVPGSAEAK